MAHTMDDLIELQMEYSENHPDDDFMFVDHFMSFGVDELVKIYNRSKGRKIIIETQPNAFDPYVVKFK